MHTAHIPMIRAALHIWLELTFRINFNLLSHFSSPSCLSTNQTNHRPHGSQWQRRSRRRTCHLQWGGCSTPSLPSDFPWWSSSTLTAKMRIARAAPTRWSKLSSPQLPQSSMPPIGTGTNSGWWHWTPCESPVHTTGWWSRTCSASGTQPLLAIKPGLWCTGTWPGRYKLTSRSVTPRPASWISQPSYLRQPTVMSCTSRFRCYSPLLQLSLNIGAASGRTINFNPDWTPVKNQKLPYIIYQNKYIIHYISKKKYIINFNLILCVLFYFILHP